MGNVGDVEDQLLEESYENVGNFDGIDELGDLKLEASEEMDMGDFEAGDQSSSPFYD